jgi:hypothetical protein
MNSTGKTVKKNKEQLKMKLDLVYITRRNRNKGGLLKWRHETVTGSMADT